MSLVGLQLAGRPDPEHALRLSRLRRDMIEVQGELASGRREAAASNNLRAQPTRLSVLSRLEELKTEAEMIAIVGDRLRGSQAGLTALREAMRPVFDSTISLPESVEGRRTLQEAAATALNALLDVTDASYMDRRLFSGSRTDQSPLNGESQPSVIEGLKQLRDEFVSAFGFSHLDPGIATISETQVLAFLDGPVAGHLTPSVWRTTWSKATENGNTFVGRAGMAVPTSVTTDDLSFRQITIGLSLLSNFGLAEMPEASATLIVRHAQSLLAEGLAGTQAHQVNLALSEQVLKDQVVRGEAERMALTKVVTELDGIDPAAASVRATELLQNLEAAYTATGRLARLSLLDQLQ